MGAVAQRVESRCNLLAPCEADGRGGRAREGRRGGGGAAGKASVVAVRAKVRAVGAVSGRSGGGDRGGRAEARRLVHQDEAVRGGGGDHAPEQAIRLGLVHQKRLALPGEHVDPRGLFTAGGVKRRCSQLAE